MTNWQVVGDVIDDGKVERRASVEARVKAERAALASVDIGLAEKTPSAVNSMISLGCSGSLLQRRFVHAAPWSDAAVASA